MVDKPLRTTQLTIAALVLAVLCALGTCASAPPAHAETTQGHAGTGTFTVEWEMAEDESWNGSFKESLITVDDEWVFCADVNNKFSGGIEVTGVDMVSKGGYSQDCVTSIAYALEKVWGEEYFAPGGERVTDDYDKYAVSNAFVWTILSKYGYQLYQGEHAYGWFSVVGLSEKGTENGCNFSTILSEAMSATVLSTYKGYGTFYDCDGHQNLVGEFSLETTEGKARIVKKSTTSATNGSSAHSNFAATFMVKGPIGEAGETTRTVTTNKKGTFTISKLTPGTYKVWETQAPANYKIGSHNSEKTAITKKVAAKKTATFTFEDKPYFGLELQKKSAYATITKSSSKHSLAGARYGLFASKSDANAAKAAARTEASVDGYKSKTVEGTWYETNASGKLATGFILDPDETYYLVEVAPSEGFGLDPQTHEVSFEGDDIVVSIESEEPVYIAFQIAKKSANANLTSGNAAYSLEGALYGVFADEKTARAADEAAAAGDYAGFESQTVEGRWYSTDADGKAGTGESFLAGLTYHLVEMAPSEGFARTAGAKEITGTSNAVEKVGVDEEPRYGLLEMMVGKIDAETTEAMKDGETPAPQGGATLAGARFAVSYYDGYFDGADNLPAKAKRTWVFETDDDGYAKYENGYKAEGPDLYADGEGRPCLPLGTVTVREVRAPSGYLLDNGAGGDPDLHIFQVGADDGAEGGAARKAVTGEWWTAYNSPDHPFPLDEDTVKRGDLNLTKADSQRANGRPQGNASLEGAVYEVVNENEHAVKSPQTGEYVGQGGVVCTIATNGDGYASTTQSDANGWSIPEGWHGALAFGEYTVREQAGGASEGYLVNEEWAQRFKIGEDRQKATAATTEDVQRGGVAVGKIDRGSRTYNQEGAATLEGAVFAIYNESDQPVKLPGESGDAAEHKPGDIVKTIEAMRVEDDSVECGYRYIAQTGERDLPFGTYRIVETETSREGYLYDDESKAWEQTFSIDHDGHWIDFTGEEDACANQVKRGDFGFRKVKGGEMVPLPGVPFKVTSETTGEWHIIVTDDNGRASTASEWVEHGHKTNGNDAAYDADEGTVNEKKLDAECGVWFHGTWNADAGRPWVETKIVESQGALPYDTYTVEELPCAANEGLTLITFTQRVYRDGYYEEMGSIEDDLPDDSSPEIGTTLANSDGERLCPADAQCALVDTVEYRNLKKGEKYALEGELHLLDGEGGVGEAIAEGSCSFEARGTSGKTEVAFEFDASALGGRSLVAFERLYDAEGDEIAVHEDPQDEFQTVTVPALETELVCDETGSHGAARSDRGTIRLVDTVRYEGLAPHKTYTVSGTLHDRETGEAVEADGAEVRAQTTFLAEEESGAVEVVFEFSDVELGRTFVAFEEVAYRERVYAVHADLEDEAQSVDVPLIATTAADAETGGHVGSHSSDGHVRIVDTVAYDKLESGVSYTLSGELHRRDSGGGDAGVVVDAETGEEVRAQAEFMPEEASGTVELPFEARVEDLAGSDFVVFEKLVRKVARDDGEDGEAEEAEVLVAEHADIADEGQTVEYPAIQTSARDDATGTRVGAAAGTVTIVDTVAYRNLVVGQEYELVGTVHVRNEDGSDAGALLDADGGEVGARATFAPEEADGEIELPFSIDASLLGGKATVVFERLFASGELVGAHEDIGDEGQTVVYPRGIATSATSKLTGTHQLECAEEACIVDAVTYEGLAANETYVMEATLHVRGEEDGDAGAYERDGEPLVVRERFTPTEASGTVEVSIPLDTRELAGQALVVFETLYATSGEEDGPVIASHADISDEGQTLTVAKVGTRATDAESGGKSGVATTRATVHDEVAYEGLVAGETYTLTGVLVNKATNAAVCEPVSVEFVAEAESGSVTMAFEVADALVGGTSLVAFEDLYDARSTLVAQHHDIDDEDQTVIYELPALRTTATDKAGGGHDAVATDDTGIVDTIAYAKLVPGKTYTVETRVVDKATGAPIVDQPTRSEFAPGSKAGTVDVFIDLSGADIRGKSLVVFERIYDEAGNLVGVHEDIDDEAQTVTYAGPAMGTTALDTQSASHKAIAEGEPGIVDHVAYEGLVAGREYTITGTLMDKSTGKAFKVDGKAVRSRKTFIPETESGTVDVEFGLRGAELEGKSLVVFERIADDSGETIAVHEDIDNASQTVSFSAPSTPARIEQAIDKTVGQSLERAGQTFAKTGGALLRFWWAALLALGGIGAGAVALARRRKAGAEPSETAEAEIDQ